MKTLASSESVKGSIRSVRHVALSSPSALVPSRHAWLVHGRHVMVWLLAIGFLGGACPSGAQQVTDAPANSEHSEPKSPPVNRGISLISPSNYQVFQRASRYDGQVWVSGHVEPELDRLEARITGQSLKGPLPDAWLPVAYDRVTRNFASPLPTHAGGWYRFELRAVRAGRVVAETGVDKTGVGEIFVIAGQSNSTNCGEAPTQQTSGMVASYSGAEWRLGDDPQRGVHDRSNSGSAWPAFGDALYQSQQVPIGIASTGHGPSSVTQWDPENDFFAWMMQRIHKLGRGGFRAVLWHQGESDVGHIDDQTYHDGLAHIIRVSQQESGWRFPWFVAMVGMQQAQRRLWDEQWALEGPDTDALHGEKFRFENGAHFTMLGLKTHGQLWAEKVSAYLDKILDERDHRIFTH